MIRPRTIVRLFTVLAVVAMAMGCGDGDGPTRPSAPEPARATTVTVSPAAAELTALGATVQLSAEARDQNGQAMAGAAMTWSSSATGVATVDGSGLVTAAGNGTVTVTATSGGASGAASVAVAQAVSEVAVSPVQNTVVEGDTLRLTAGAADANGHAVAGVEFVWASGDTLVAVVDDSGLVWGVAAGTATITAAAGSASGTATVTVAAPNVDAIFDSLMIAFTRERDIGAAALGIMRDGVIVYDRAFGWMDRERTVPIRQDVMMRLASVTKPITAAVIHELVRDGALDLDALVFDLGQPGGGLLDLAPFPALADARLADITVRHLLQHRGGWDRSIAGDLTWREIEIAEAMSVPSPPGRENTVRYILGQPLQFDPGSQRVYSNIGYLVLGLIIEEVSGQNYLSQALSKVLVPLGVRSDDVLQGRTFPADRSDREPWYDHYHWVTTNVFDPGGPPVPWPDGGWDQESKIASGGLVSTTRAVLRFLDVFKVSGDDIGTRRRRGAEPNGWRWFHTGSLPGVSTLARQRWDGINVVVFFNRRPTSGTAYTHEIDEKIADILDNTPIVWPHSGRVVGTGGGAAHP